MRQVRGFRRWLGELIAGGPIVVERWAVLAAPVKIPAGDGYPATDRDLIAAALRWDQRVRERDEIALNPQYEKWGAGDLDEQDWQEANDDVVDAYGDLREIIAAHRRHEATPPDAQVRRQDVAWFPKGRRVDRSAVGPDDRAGTHDDPGRDGGGA